MNEVFVRRVINVIQFALCYQLLHMCHASKMYPTCMCSCE